MRIKITDEQGKQKKITLVNCGGTISSAYDGNTVVCGKVSTFAVLGNVKTVSPFSVLSENMTAERLEVLAQTIRDEQNECDAVVVTHGTDTLVQSAAYVSLSLAGTTKPVFLVSSDYPLSNPRANGNQNLALSLAAINYGIGGGVYVPYQNRGEKPVLHFAARLLEVRPFDAALYSAANKICGKINTDGVFQQTESVCAKNLLPPINPHNAKNAAKNNTAAQKVGKVELVFPYVGLNYLALAKRLKAENAVAVIVGTHSGTVKTEGENSMQALDGITAYLAGGVKGSKYESLKKLPPSIVPVDNIAPMALYYKVCLAYANFCNAQAQKDYIFANTAGEFFDL